VRTNQLDFDEEVVFKAQQYLYNHVRENAEQPFCLTVSMTHPHDPYCIPEEFWSLYRDEDIPLPGVNIDQQELDPHSQRILKVIDLWGKDLPEEKIRDARRAYFGACSYIDSNIGKLLKTLGDCGLAEDTIIIFSGDHGDMLGERGLWYKMHWFEMAARVPFVVHAPSKFTAHRVSQSMSTADLLPTLVELAGGAVDPSLPLDGRSLLPHLQGNGGHDEVLGEYMGEGTNSPLMMIRRGDWKFIYSEVDPLLLFNVANDPKELENLAQSPDHQGLLTEFLEDARQRWDIPAIHQATLASQRRRRFVAESLTKGKLKSWDHQPMVDASQQYMRNHIDLDDLERRARFPQP
jgi:choline-sulfatase